MQQPQIVLNNSVRMPQIGFGVFQIQDCVGVVKTALQAGYRLLDTAQTYCNEREVGRGIRESGLAREEVFVTTKVWVTEYGKEKTRKSLDASLERLGFDYVDMVLLHFPVPHVFERTIEAWQGAGHRRVQFPHPSSRTPHGRLYGCSCSEPGGAAPLLQPRVPDGLSCKARHCHSGLVAPGRCHDLRCCGYQRASARAAGRALPR